MTSLAPELQPSGVAAPSTRRRSRTETLFGVGVFALFAVLWAAFAVALVWSQGSLDQAWQWIRSLPLILQAVVAFLFLPVVAGLWIWESTWPLIVRVILVVGLGAWNLYVFRPRSPSGGRPDRAGG